MILSVLEEKLSTLLNELGYETEVKCICSDRPDLCDYQCNSVFTLAKKYHKNPVDIGEEIIERIKKDEEYNDYFELVDFVKPGFINMRVSSTLIQRQLKYMNDNSNFGLKPPVKRETFILDYGGPNIAKPLHVGHMRTAIVGESIKRIIKYMGHNVISDVHLGDYGLQIGQVIYGIQQENIKLEDITIEFLEKTYPKISALCKSDVVVKEKCERITKKLQDGDLDYQKLWKKILEVSKKDIEKIYNFLDVHFDFWNGESDSYKYIEETSKYLFDKGLMENSDGALVISVNDINDKKEIPPLIFQKSNGGYLYSTTDVATIYGRVLKYNPDHILYVVDNRQELHFEQVFRVCDKSSMIEKSKLEFLGYGTVNGPDGKPFKTRNGDTPRLDSLFSEIRSILLERKASNSQMRESDLEKIINSVLKFADLQNNRKKDYIFDIPKFSNVVGKTGPYILYTYLRINKLLKECNYTGGNLTDEIYNESDRNLRLKLVEFDLSIKSAFKDRMPSYIADYLYSLCLLANNFYQNNRIINLKDMNKKQNWLYILNVTNKLIKDWLYLIVIEIPEYM